MTMNWLDINWLWVVRWAFLVTWIGMLFVGVAIVLAMQRFSHVLQEFQADMGLTRQILRDTSSAMTQRLLASSQEHIPPPPPSMMGMDFGLGILFESLVRRH